jgi:hypothetical protein
MGELLDHSFTAADRYPRVVLAGHVHDGRIFNRSLAGYKVTYLVCRNSG